ncbi:duboraya isoform X2 [Channa argus]|uniref:duboraya isoform X2 n=1 Tax=Channa argus TaxID=215402 RepID=UPI003522D34C
MGVYRSQTHRRKLFDEVLEEAPSRRSVAELAGRFKGSAPPHDAPANETEKPVRRRPPRSLKIPQPQVDEQEPSDGTSLPTTIKRNSGLIEKLQAKLILSPTAKAPSPKSPSFSLLSPGFTPPSPGSTSGPTSSKTTPTSPVATTPLTEEERPVSFEDPLSAAEPSILPSINKNRARHSLRRRPPSRRHRKSSSGDEVSVVNDVVETTLSSLDKPEDKTTAGREGHGGSEEQVGGQVFEKEAETDEVKDEKTDASTCPEQSKDDQSLAEPAEEDEKKKEGEERSIEGQDGSSSERKDEEEEKEEKQETQDKSEDEQKDVSSEEVTNTDGKEEGKNEVTPSLKRAKYGKTEKKESSQSSAR